MKLKVKSGHIRSNPAFKQQVINPKTKLSKIKRRNFKKLVRQAKSLIDNINQIIIDDYEDYI